MYEKYCFNHNKEFARILAFFWALSESKKFIFTKNLTDFLDIS